MAETTKGPEGKLKWIPGDLEDGAQEACVGHPKDITQEDEIDATRRMEVTAPSVMEEGNLLTLELLASSSSGVVEPKEEQGGSSSRHNAPRFKLTSKYHPLPSENSGFEKIKRESKVPEWFKKGFLYLVLTGILSGYACGGAFLFSSLEKQRETEYNAKIDKWKNDTAILLATELRQVSPHEAIWARKVFYYLEVFEKDLLKASAIGYRRWDDEDREQRWTWSRSLFFSLSLMTTTGYGTMTPRSKYGRASAIIYSFVGIPLALTWFLITGRFLALCLASLVCCSRCSGDVTAENNLTQIHRGKVRQNSVAPVRGQRLIDAQKSASGGGERYPGCTAEKAELPSCRSTYCLRKYFETQRADMPLDLTMATVCSLLLLTVYFVLCSVVFALLENWEMVDMFYFNYLLFTTLGPGCHESEDRLELRLKGNTLFLAFLCLGYCILSTTANLAYLLARGLHQRELGANISTDSSGRHGMY